MTQSHWFRIEDGKIIEHWANRDDLGMARQLGWIPPTPAYLFKMARAKRRAKRPDHRCSPHVTLRKPGQPRRRPAARPADLTRAPKVRPTRSQTPA